MTIDSRRHVLKLYGATGADIEALLAYNENVFDHDALTFPLRFPLPDQPFVIAWETYANEAPPGGVFDCLKKRLTQLAFPIEEGMSERQDYRAVTRKGVPPPPESAGLELNRPQELQLVLHPTPAGRIPLLITGHREDFVTLVRAFALRNEPRPIAESMGACVVKGYNNWDRVRALREAWQAENPSASPMGWQFYFRSEIIPHKDLYQDRFIILSDGPYSAVPAVDMGLPEEDWKRLSLIIRREHECAHYFTERLFGSMRNNLLDELIADYSGIVAAAGHYRADWFLRFVGLESFPDYRQGGRLQNYRGHPPLTDSAFAVLKALVKDAAQNLERFDSHHEKVIRGEKRTLVIMSMTCLTLEELASKQAETLLEENLTRFVELRA